MSSEGRSGDWRVELIQRRMAQIRRDLFRTVDEIGDQARQLRDWRYYLRRYPWFFAATAAGVGYLAVPARPRVIHVDAGVAPGGEARVPVEVRGRVVRSIAGVALEHLGRVLLKSATQYAVQRIGAPGRSFGEPSNSGRSR